MRAHILSLICSVAGAHIASASPELTPEAQLAELVETGVSSANMCADLEHWSATLPRAEETTALFVEIDGYRNACSLPAADLTENQALAALGDAPLSAKLSGDILTLFARSDQREPYLCCSISSAAWKQLGDSDLWAARLRLADTDRALLKLALFSPAAGGLSDFIDIRGEHAPAPGLFMSDPDEALEGKLIETTLASPELGETRHIIIYLPPGHKPDDTTATLVLADGGSTGHYARMIEPMIKAGLIASLAIVGIPSGAGGIVDPPAAFDRVDLRATDYVPGWSEDHPRRFNQHMDFVAQTLIPWSRREYGLSTQRAHTGVAGQSNGGVFALYAGYLHGDTFAVSIPVSPGWTKGALRTPNAAPDTAARFFIAAGLYEPRFLDSAQISANGLTSAGYNVTTSWNAAGHSRDQTEAMLARYLPLAFPPSTD